MKNRNIFIKDIAYYHPDNSVDNEYFIKHFDAQGIDIRGLLKSTGRKSRYLSDDPNETILTMGLKATQTLLEKTKIDPQELNLIVFSTGTPEYIAPSNAAKIHEFIMASQKCAVFDLNSNCAGMLVSLDLISRYMVNNSRIKYALIIGSDQLNKYSRYSEAIPYANFGDSACAIILESTSNGNYGFVDSDPYTNSKDHDKILLPAKGLSSALHNKELGIADKLVQWSPFDGTGSLFSAKISIEDILTRNNLKKESIKKYFLSQFSWDNIVYICNQLGENIDKFAFIGDEFGYTGTTSPLLAFARTIENGELQKGDYVIFWTVGAGSTCSTILYRY